jgi:hypothetical protein
LARQVGAFARLDDLIKLRMANHAGGWAPGVLVHFGSLDFIVTMRVGLEQIHVPIHSTRIAILDPVVEAFEGLRLYTPWDRASRGDWLLDFDHERLRRQLRAFLGPRQTRRI